MPGRQKYDSEFKRAAVELVGACGKTMTELERELGHSFSGWYQMVGERFVELGIDNIHDPRFLSWVEPSKHAKCDTSTVRSGNASCSQIKLQKKYYAKHKN